MVDHGKNLKRKKFHDKDKYYRLAKEQGLRSRAAFKLSQINRQYPILDKNTKVVLDLCAAPGGWTQIAARECGPNTQIVAVDILPIRKIVVPKSGGGTQQAITTIVGDITTDKCKAEIRRAIATTQNTPTSSTTTAKSHAKVDVVLHDGAPNVGASYDRDAYEQMELSVHALRCATQHLKKGGVFCTKIYRSKDSASFQWVVQQLFQEVTMFKPKASRPQSAEIFYICQGYHAPQKIDPKLLDPQHIFELVEGDTTGGAGTKEASQNFHVFHKNWEKANQKNRQGYDWTQVDANLRKIEPVSNFVLAKGNMAAIQLLSTCTGFTFSCENLKDTSIKEEHETTCQFLLHHPLTTLEIKECLVDLKVLNKGDFKGLMIWRDKMNLALDAIREDKDSSDDDTDSDDESVVDGTKGRGDRGTDEDDDDEHQIQKEIQALRERKLREQKKAKKKERKVAAKKRRQAALGMDLNAIEVQEDDQFFSLSTLKSSADLLKVSEVNIDQATDEQVFGVESEDDEEGDLNLGKIPDRDEATGYSYRLERDLDAAYDRYLENTKNGAAKKGTKAAKRSKKLMREKLAEESHEDHEILLTNPEGMSEDLKAYTSMLQGPQDSDDDNDDNDSSSSDDDDEDDGFDAEPMTAEEHDQQRAAKKQKLMQKEKNVNNPLIHRFAEESVSAKTARWFSNPLFTSMSQAAESAQAKSSSNEPRDEADVEDSDSDSELRNEEVTPSSRSRPGNKTNKSGQDDTQSSSGLNADDVLAMMPKTDKQRRHELRLKALARDERRQARKAKKLGEAEGEFALVPAEDDDDNGDDTISKMEGMSDEKKQKLQRARDLIKAGMGATRKDDSNDGGSNRNFEIVEAERPLPVVDERRYDSENEEYDSDDYAKTMALGTMMLRKSKAKALVDASYNRYAWNDPADLPEWFVDDENRHYRPQLPIPEALLQKMKAKQAALSVRPIAKVAEARARKNRNAKHKLAAAKKKANALAGASDMSEAMKLKQISKALRSTDVKKFGKEKIVSKKGRKGVKGATMVDKRLKCDTRSMKRAEKKKRKRR